MPHFLIIAAGSDIGAELATQLKAAGHTVSTTARDTTKYAANYTLDATDFAAVDAVFAKAIATHGQLAGVVNCAGSLLLKPAHLTSAAEYLATINASLTTSFAVVAAAGKHMANNGGSVVLISSAAAQTGIANHEAIAAAKAGVIGLMQSAAATYAPVNIRVNAVAPGLVATKLAAGITGNEMALKFSTAMHALGRIGSTADVARAINFLLQPENSWITGQVLGVDGGLGHVRPKMKV